MKRIKKIATSLEDEIKILENKLENETCKNKINELQAEIKANGLGCVATYGLALIAKLIFRHSRRHERRISKDSASECRRRMA